MKPCTLFRKRFAEVGSEFLSCCVLRGSNLVFVGGWLGRTSSVYQAMFGNGMVTVAGLRVSSWHRCAEVSG